MSQGKSMMVDTSRCTACRGCQVACKQWHGLPGTRTRQTGTYQNPPDFSAQTWKVVRFSEGQAANGKPYWYFFSDMCRHCLNPGCMEGNQKDEIVQDAKTGAVLYSPATKKLNYKDVRGGCPYNVPRQDPKTKEISKCNLCIDRLRDNLIPACAKSCPTGALVFGDREAILKQVADRVAELKKTHPKAKALNADDVRVIFVVTDEPEKYHQYAEA
ncbi:MAG: 4Fe-4S dicluster domain-containing protein [Pseudomonadota bacterium]